MKGGDSRGEGSSHVHRRVERVVGGTNRRVPMKREEDETRSGERAQDQDTV